MSCPLRASRRIEKRDIINHYKEARMASLHPHLGILASIPTHYLPRSFPLRRLLLLAPPHDTPPAPANPHHHTESHHLERQTHAHEDRVRRLIIPSKIRRRIQRNMGICTQGKH